MNRSLANDLAKECPGRGQCHDGMQWCYQCGDVDSICNAEYCHCPRCIDCNTKLSMENYESEYVRCEICRAKSRCATTQDVQEEIDSGSVYPARGRW